MRAMDYAEVREAFFQPRDAGAPEPGTSGWQSPARRLRDAIEPIAMICWWSEPAYDAYAALGLDFLQGYVWSRGCVLGEPDGGVVAAAFGVFEPGLIGQLYDAARAAAGLADIRAAREAGAVTALRTVLGGTARGGTAPERLAEVTGALRRGVEAADTAGRPLFAGLAGLPWPADELGQLWHACTMLRELRGDSHLAACVAAGLTGLEANILTELQVGWPLHSYTATRAWPPEAMNLATLSLRERGLIAGDALTGAGASLRADIEEATDRQLAPVLDAIGPALPGILPPLREWSRQIVGHGWFPPDPYKRASG
jgi:helix-turn-helix protein